MYSGMNTSYEYSFAPYAKERLKKEMDEKSQEAYGFYSIFGWLVWDQNIFDKKWWADFEMNLKNVNVDEFAMFFGKEEDDVEELLEYVPNAKKYIAILFKDWLKSVIIYENMKYNLNKTENKFINFNYSETLQKCFNVNEDKVYYIHGAIHKDDVLIFGHNAKGKYTQEDIDNATRMGGRLQTAVIFDALIEKVFNKFISKNCEKLDESKFIKYKNVRRVFVLGHSMNDVDFDYFVHIGTHIAFNAPEESQIEWIFTAYNEDDKTRIESYCEKFYVKNKIYRGPEAIDDVIKEYGLSIEEETKRS